MSSERRIEITTVSTGSDDCDDGRTCPGVHTVADRPGVYYLIVNEVTDRAELAAFASRIGPGDLLGTTPRRLIDALPR